MHMTTRARGPLIACLLLCLTLSGCGQPIVRTETVTVKVPVVQPVPAELTVPVASPALTGDTNGALAEYILALKHALDTANAKLKAIAGLQP